MPRGLGEDPLTRKRKASRLAASRYAADGPAPGSSGLGSPSQSPLQGGAALNSSSSRPTAHSDVFFRKRSESGPASSSPAPVHEVEEQAISEPEFAPQVVAEPVVSEPILPAPIEVAPAIPSPPIEEPVVSIPESAPQASAPHEEVVSAQPAAPAPAAPERAPAAHVEPAPQEGGILKRLFGRFRK
jgi:hypothetical protein